MNALTAILTGSGLGCLAMYSFDPETGRRRRALARDKLAKIQRRAGEAAVTARDLKNRTLGVVAEGRSLLTERSVPDDAPAAERVRSEPPAASPTAPRSQRVSVSHRRSAFSQTGPRRHAAR